MRRGLFKGGELTQLLNPASSAVERDNQGQLQTKIQTNWRSITKKATWKHINPSYYVATGNKSPCPPHRNENKVPGPGKHSEIIQCCETKSDQDASGFCRRVRSWKPLPGRCLCAFVVVVSRGSTLPLPLFQPWKTAMVGVGWGLIMRHTITLFLPYILPW